MPSYTETINAMVDQHLATQNYPKSADDRQDALEAADSVGRLAELSAHYALIENNQLAQDQIINADMQAKVDRVKAALIANDPVLPSDVDILFM